MSNNEIDIHMSDLDEETKRILAEVESDDSKESLPPKKEEKKEIITEKEGYDDYYEDTRDKLPEGEEPDW